MVLSLRYVLSVQRNPRGNDPAPSCTLKTSTFVFIKSTIKQRLRSLWKDSCFPPHLVIKDLEQPRWTSEQPPRYDRGSESLAAFPSAWITCFWVNRRLTVRNCRNNSRKRIMTLLAPVAERPCCPPRLPSFWQQHPRCFGECSSGSSNH